MSKTRPVYGHTTSHNAKQTEGMLPSPKDARLAATCPNMKPPLPRAHHRKAGGVIRFRTCHKKMVLQEEKEKDQPVNRPPPKGKETRRHALHKL